MKHHFKYMKTIIKNLPQGSKSKSIHSPRDLLLMKYESLRRKHNRSNKESLSFITFMHLYYSKKLREPINEVMVIGRLTVEIMAFNKSEYYLDVARYNNNHEVI